ncbi:unnamed protein product [Sphenostylis stenocarpa]|uniref:Uncharacterized protein n=1 Tax=Sphenostylis stenocarpa TaxID=92480 RepID=A0AA86RXW7_9FABA|nr:unnamed protein product [Sphenostylis stenocarpa]
MAMQVQRLPSPVSNKTKAPHNYLQCSPTQPEKHIINKHKNKHRETHGYVCL